MGAGAVFHYVCAAAPQPSQEKRLPPILQADTEIERPAFYCALCRYNCTCLTTNTMYFTCRNIYLPHGGSNVKGRICVLFLPVCVQDVFFCWLLSLHHFQQLCTPICCSASLGWSSWWHFHVCCITQV